MATEILLGIIIVLLIIVIFLLFKKMQIEPKDIENVILKVWKESGLSDKVGELTVHAR